MSRLDALEAKLIETTPAATRSTVEQLRERTSTQSLAITKLQQEVKVLREQVAGLESAVLSLASPQDTIQDSQGDSETDITRKPYDLSALSRCPGCLPNF